jgi:hypothetical protein
MLKTDPFLVNITQHISAIRLCLDKKHQIPALTLIYNAIDVLGAISRNSDKPYADKSDFIRWSEAYLRCNELLNVSGVDLYSARCGILHTYTGHSHQSDRGNARVILYAWGNRDILEPQKTLEQLGFNEVFVKIESLLDALIGSVGLFCEELDRDDQLRELIQKRANRFYMDYSNFPDDRDARL